MQIEFLVKSNYKPNKIVVNEFGVHFGSQIRTWIHNPNLKKITTLLPSIVDFVSYYGLYIKMSKFYRFIFKFGTNIVPKYQKTIFFSKYNQMGHATSISYNPSKDIFDSILGFLHLDKICDSKLHFEFLGQL